MAAHQLSAELDGFLMEAEGCLIDIERSSCDRNDVTAMDGLLQQAEWLLRDVLLIEELLPQPEGELLYQVW